MINDEIKSRISAATLTIETADSGNGRAFLVAGGYLLTAAHCVDFNLDGTLVLGDYHLQFVETISGKRFRVSPVMIDPVSDLAVLGPPDDQEFSEDCELFQEFIDATTPIDIEFENPSTDDEVHIFTHLKTWIGGTVWVSEFAKLHSSFFAQMREAIVAGTSGSALVNRLGKAVGIVSVFMGPDAESGKEGQQPLIHQCLPKFLYDAIYSMQNSSQD